jgi:hypothetical protein
MIRIAVILSGIVLLTSCDNKKKEIIADKRIVLRTDTVNVIKLSDTLLIQESTCRGCAYEESTTFDISDSLGIIRLDKIITTDNNPANVDGGSISKLLVLVPLKTGKTAFKLYKFWEQPATAADSVNYSIYTIEVKN